jgi:hypothetical protein
MAPIKFEEQLKDKLEKRTLSPSADGWSKLSERLDTDEKKSKNPLFWWLSIAAGLIIMMAISIQFFNKGEAMEVIPEIVEGKLKEEQLELKESNSNDSKSIDWANEIDRIEAEKESLQIITEPQIIDYKKVTHKKTKTESQFADNTGSIIKKNKPKNLEENKKEIAIITDKSIMEDAVADALKEFKSQESTTVTDKEIDSLLKVASKELFKDKLQKEAFKTVDASALLLSVEEDMGQSFRSKVFDALKGGYETVKTAVVERNN